MLGDITGAAAHKAKNAAQPAANAPKAGANPQATDPANAEASSSSDVKEPEIDPEKQLKAWKIKRGF